MVVTFRTNIYRHARTPEGVDLYGGVPGETEVQTSRTGDTIRRIVPAQRAERANVTNIEEGSFVTVRYRRVGNVNEVLNLSVVELPRVTPDRESGLVPAGSAPGGGTGPGTPTDTGIAPGTAVPSGAGAGATIPPTTAPLLPRIPPGNGVVPTAPPVRGGTPAGSGGARVPTVPTQPVAPAISP